MEENKENIQEELKPKKDTPMRSAFCTFPVDDERLKGLSEEEVCQWFCNTWVRNMQSRQAICTYCVSADGYHHVHMVCSSDKQFRWSAVKKTFPMCGDIGYTQGTKKQALAYIRKEGKFAEEGEVVKAEFSIGDIQDNQGMRTDLDKIGALLDEGLKPAEIMAINLKYRKHEKIIKDAFFAKRAALTPFMRDVYVEWHCGESGSGKTHFIMDLIEAYGEDEVYFLTDYDNGGMDKYNGEHILFLDEFRGQIRFSTLLSMLDVYKAQIHNRFTNGYGLWNRVYITSPLPPEQIYKKLVSAEDRENDSMKQLFRRINTIVYHWKDGEEYKEFRLPMEQYHRYEELKHLAGNFEFVTPTKEEQMHIQDWLTE